MEPWSKSSKEANPGFSFKSRPAVDSGLNLNEEDDPSIISISNFENSNRNRHFEH